MIVISNTGPLIAVAKIDRLDLLKHYFKEIYVSPATYHELTEKGRNKTGAQEIARSHWIKVKPVKDLMAVKILEMELDAGEAETLVLGHECKADLLLLDESIARRIAVALNLKVKGTIGILVKAKNDQLLERLKPILDQLRAKGVWISDEVYREALRLAGE